MLYGDPNGAAHKTTFPVPVITSGTTKVEIRNVTADFNTTGLTLSGSNTTLKLAFSGLIHVEVTLPVIGSVKPDVTIKPSSLSVAVSYDKTTAKVKLVSVTAAITTSTKNCGFLGFCNGIVDNYLKDNLKGLIEPPLADALTKALDDPNIPKDLEALLAFGYNRKDPQPTAWTLVSGTLAQAAGAYTFTVTRP